mgnify:CR=1 FL=1
MRLAALLMPLVLAGCGSPEQAPAPQASEPAPAAAVSPAPVAPPTLGPIPQPTPDLAVLDSRDCRTVALAYAYARARGDFALAARGWNDPVIDDARLKALLARYKQPSIALSGLEPDGAAGSSYCTVSGSLTDAGDKAQAASKGEIVLKRVNDVPGATPSQLRWTIRSSTFVEKMQRTG